MLYRLQFLPIAKMFFQPERTGPREKVRLGSLHFSLFMKGFAAWILVT
jgi:hypothetical protein